MPHRTSEGRRAGGGSGGHGVRKGSVGCLLTRRQDLPGERTVSSAKGAGNLDETGPHLPPVPHEGSGYNTTEEHAAPKHRDIWFGHDFLDDTKCSGNEEKHKLGFKKII